MDKNNSQAKLQDAIMDFVTRYGLLGFMTALPITPEFITYHAVYLPKNHFIKEESLTTEKYLSYFFPFDKIDFRKRGRESSWSTDSVEMMALIMSMKDKPQAVLMSFQKEYAERYDRPTIVWDFHSLLLGVQMMFSFMVTDEKSTLKVCKHCGSAFVASRPNSVFCNGKCKNQYNVYKSRAKDKDGNN